MKLISTLLVVIGGMGLGTEAGILGPLGGEVGHYWATLSIFGIGTAILFFIVLLFASRSSKPLISIPRWQLTGGMLGPLYVAIMTVAAPVIGVAMAMTGILAGQIAKSMLIDHYGWFDSAPRPFNQKRVIALVLVIAALLLIAKGN